MTKNEIHRRALLAAAKIALVTVGCSGNEAHSDTASGASTLPEVAPPAATATATVTAVAPPPGATATATSTAPTPTASASAPSDAGLPPATCHLPVYSLPTDDDVACCQAEVKKALAGTTQLDLDGGAPAGDLVACCGVVIDYYDQHQTPFDEGVLTYEQRSACCAVVGAPLPIGPTCTPWGPPPPPAMPAMPDLSAMSAMLEGWA